MAKATYTSPGVYVQEIVNRFAGVSEGSTAVPAFVGCTEKAILFNKSDLLFVPKKISSVLEYEQHFGQGSTSKDFVLYPSIRLYFANGGNACYIVSIGNYKLLKRSKFIKGLQVLEEEKEPTLLVFPDAVNLPGDDLYKVQKAALQQAATLKDRFCILDLKVATTEAEFETVTQEFRNQIGSENLKYGAAYFPHLLTGASIENSVPPSGAVAGVYCMVDNSVGVWKAPANVSLAKVSGLTYKLTEQQGGELNVDATAGLSINAIREFSGKGVVIWGARTLAGNDNEWRYVPVCRFLIQVKESISKSLEPFVFEPNDANIWSAIKAMIEGYLAQKWRDGALVGNKAEEAFFVKLGLGETMTALDISNNKAIVEIGMATIRPAEFIIIRIDYCTAS